LAAAGLVSLLHLKGEETHDPRSSLFAADYRHYGVFSGKDALLLVLDGEPFRVRTHVVTVLIGGKIVDVSNHQTELYKTFKNQYGIS